MLGVLKVLCVGVGAGPRHEAGGGGSYGLGAWCHAHLLGAGKTHDFTVNAASSEFLEPHKAEGFHQEELYGSSSQPVAAPC